MKKKNSVIEFYRIIRWKNHLRNVAKRNTRKLRATKRDKTILTSHSEKKSTQFQFESARLTNEFKVLSPTSLPSKRELKQSYTKFRIPKEFDIYENPESVLCHIAKFRALALNKSTNGIRFIHNSVNTCMPSEALLGISAAEISEHREKVGCDIVMRGNIYHSSSDTALIENAGIVAELHDGAIMGSPTASLRDIFRYEKDNKQFDSASITAEDIKNETAEGCIKQLSKGLERLLLKLNSDVAQDLVMCLGEILDNVNEHCYRTAPIWYVRSYLNTNEKCQRYFELMVMNVGHSIAKTFEILPENSKTKTEAMSYVNKHAHLFTQEELLTVLALQGNVSSKKDKEITRGQGSIRLIETFEQISKDFVKLRGKGKETKKNDPIMNIISGHTVIKFDGKYHRKVVKHADGVEDVYIPFNEEQSLAFPPDKTSVSRMTNAYFPGVMVNIRIPLNGSTTPLSNNAEGK
ncbi:hypothetical protein [Vibrio atlanticus]|uniref:hypothetical protein n=1 Tax=Vibrio atlanticus TaxID=693153 RepID=UPI003D1007E8